MEFPSNSQNPIRPLETGPKPPEKGEPKPDLKVIDKDTKVIRRKRTVGQKLKDMFLVDGRKKIEAYVVDILLPTAQDMLFETAVNTLARGILGEERAKLVSPSAVRSVTTRLVGNAPRTHTDYDRFSKPTTILGRSARVHHDFGDFILPTHTAATKVIDQMVARADRYGAVTVADFYEMLDIEEEATFADQKYGWTLADLQYARPRASSGGFLIDVPKPEPLRIR